MKRTYYDILGVSRNASLEEITNAKNALAKIYHPDANIKDGIDTTAYMQEILEAYRVLSNKEKRQKYDNKIGTNKKHRNFKTFDIKNCEEETTVSFVTYWNAALRLHDAVNKSAHIFDKESKNVGVLDKLKLKLGKDVALRPTAIKKLNSLASEAMSCIITLRNGNIPTRHWHHDAMNWVLVRWGQKQTCSFDILFSKYDAYANENKSAKEKLKISNELNRFQSDLKRLLEYK